jgi:hypothetical protein
MSHYRNDYYLGSVSCRRLAIEAQLSGSPQQASSDERKGILKRLVKMTRRWAKDAALARLIRPDAHLVCACLNPFRSASASAVGKSWSMT